MKLTISKYELIKALEKVIKIPNTSNLLPILSNVLMMFTGKTMQIFATNLEISAIVEIPIESEKEKICVHAQSFYNIIKSFKADEVSIEKSDQTLIVKQGRSIFKLALVDPEEFPERQTIIPDIEFTLDAQSLKRMIDKVDFAISTDPSRYALTGMYLGVADQTLILCGTDGFRMAKVEELTDQRLSDTKRNCVIPKNFVKFVESVVNGKIKIGIGSNQIEIETENAIMQSRLIESAYPEFENLIPKNSNIVTVDRESLLAAIKQVALITNKDPINLDFSNNTINVNSQGDLGQASAEVEATYQGDPVHLTFQPVFLVDVLQHVDNENASIELPESYGAVFFPDGNYINLIMPIRI